MADPPADESVNFSARRSSRGHYAALAAGLMVLLFIGRSELPPLEDTTEVLARGLSTGVLGGFILGAAAQTEEGACGASIEPLETQLESRGPKPPLSPIEGGFDDSEDAQTFEELYQWAANISGQEPLIRVGKVCRDEGAGEFCMRGTYATRDIKATEQIAILPVGAYLVLPEATVEAWLTMQHGDPHFNATFGPWLATLPRRGEILTADGMSPAEVAMVQGGPLEERFRVQANGMMSAWHASRASNATDIVRRLGISLPEYAHIAMTIASRYWGFHRPNGTDGGEPEVLVTLAPLLDMTDHAEDFNAYVSKNGNDSMIMVALADIPAGKEVSITYSQNKLHRPDMAMLNYGFLPKRRPPLLCAYDLGAPEAERMRKEGGFIMTPPNDDEYKLGGRMGTHAELRRLLDLLASFPTTEAADRQRLQEDTSLTWRQRTLLEFRAERKAAIRFNAARLADGFVEWQALVDRLDAKWDNYADFEPSGASTNPVTASDGEEVAAGGTDGGGAAAARPKLRLDWEAAWALLAAANASSKA